jgi:hypothetical protein
MHPYAIDTDARERILLIIAVAGAVLAYSLQSLFELTNITLPILLKVLIDVPSVSAIYWCIYNTFDKKLWKISLIKRTGLVTVPDLSGEWDCEGESTYGKGGTKFYAKSVIEQTWSHMSIRIETENSKSHSLIGGILTKSLEGPVLTYEYWNEPKTRAVKTMHPHRGTAHLSINKNADIIEGEYYTGKHREEQGSLKLKRKV